MLLVSSTGASHALHRYLQNEMCGCSALQMAAFLYGQLSQHSKHLCRRLPLLPRLIALRLRPAAGRSCPPEQVAHARLRCACNARGTRVSSVGLRPGFRWGYVPAVCGGDRQSLATPSRYAVRMTSCREVCSGSVRHFRGGLAESDHGGSATLHQL